MLSKRVAIPSALKPFVPILRRPIYRKTIVNVSSLPNDEDVKNLFDTLNNKANEEYKDYVRNTLSIWKPTKKYVSTIMTLPNRNLEMLFQMYRRYVPPLEDFEKLLIRRQLLNDFEKSKTDEERRFYHSILDYYDLIEDY